jgi:Uma2 family endonuclease
MLPSRSAITQSTHDRLLEYPACTDAEFMALGRDGHRHEWVNGQLIDMGNSGAKHGYLAIILSAALFTVVAAQKLGALLDSSTAFKMKNGNKRSPDISFFAKERLQGLDDLPIGFLEGAPDLVIEMLSLATIDGLQYRLFSYQNQPLEPQQNPPEFRHQY